ncbi:MAG: SpoIIE family protein phosphatase [Sedimentisphaerales bacterium]|nr:SpoIIE family protein phosphatase [Sedimentisphaerales bacterium]
MSDDANIAGHFSADGICLDHYMPYMVRERFSPGQTIFKRGDKAAEMYYIEEGTVKLPEIGKRLNRGDFFGEMAMFSPANERTASAVCVKDLTVLSISREALLEMLRSKPSQAFPLLQLALGRFSEDLRSETIAKERMESELRIARDIQASVLPSEFPVFPDRDEFSLFASMDPARLIGGDFYDFFLVDEDNLFVVVADVSGKGVPAALFMMIVRTLINAAAKEGLPPEALLQHVNELVYPDNKNFMFVTVLCAIINVKTGAVQFGNAGHNPPLIGRIDGSVQYHELPPATFLGLGDLCNFSVDQTQLEPGDTLLMYTDGVTEAMGHRQELYGEERLLQAFRRLNRLDMQNLVHSIRADVSAFVEGAPQNDDVTMLAFRLNDRRDT